MKRKYYWICYGTMNEMGGAKDWSPASHYICGIAGSRKEAAERIKGYNIVSYNKWYDLKPYYKKITLDQMTQDLWDLLAFQKQEEA